MDWVPAAGAAVGLTIAPGRRGLGVHSGVTWQRDLGADLERLRAVERVDVLVTLMEPRELAAYGLADLRARARSAGMRSLALPIPDGGTPASGWPLADLLAQLRAASGERVAVHCLGGLGRSGLVVGCLLTDLGWSAAGALEALRRARGPSCPETAAQVEYIRGWAARRRRAA